MPTLDNCGLLALPEELLVYLLAPLDLLTLRSCFSTCRQLNRTIKSSALINYGFELQAMNLIDDPAVSYDEIPLNRRLEMLSKHRERLRTQIIWKTRADMPEIFSFPSGSMKGDANILYDGTMQNSFEDENRLRWTNLPSQGHQGIEWNIIQPSNLSATVIAYTISIEENDLLALALCRPFYAASFQPGTVLLPIQIEFIQHTLQIPYPGIPSPILDICVFSPRVEGLPVVNIAIRGTNMAVMVGYQPWYRTKQYFGDKSTLTGRLSVWNWKTGEKIFEKLNIPDRDQSLVFLREDILVHGSSNPSLDVYHVASPDCEPRLIERLGVPKVRGNGLTLLSFYDNPAVVPSFTLSYNPKVTRLFTGDNLGSILAIKMTIEDRDEYGFQLFTHHRTLLGRADRALSRYESGQDVAGISVSWDKWGPEVTKMFRLEDDDHLSALWGSRFFKKMFDNEFIEIFDFGRGDGALKVDNQSPSHFPSSVEQGDDDACQRDYEVDTKLPFVYQTLEAGIDTLHWDSMFVDQSRILGQTNSYIDVLYIGGEEIQ